MLSQPVKSGFYRAEVARRLLQEVAQRLRTANIRVMPLKGVLLQATVYQPSYKRWLTDVDILVREADLAAAVHLLREAGFSCAATQKHELLCCSGAYTLPLDVHTGLFATGIFCQSAEAVWSRAARDSTLFGVEVWLPDPLDVYSHVIGHFVKSRGLAFPAQHFEDLALLARRHALDPQRCARHLELCGMQRAARYVLALSIEQTGDAFAAAVLRALRRDPLGSALAEIVGAAMPHLPTRSRLAGAVPHLLDGTLRAAAMGIPRRALAVLREAKTK